MEVKNIKELQSILDEYAKKIKRKIENNDVPSLLDMDDYEDKIATIIPEAYAADLLLKTNRKVFAEWFEKVEQHIFSVSEELNDVALSQYYRKKSTEMLKKICDPAVKDEKDSDGVLIEYSKAKEILMQDKLEESDWKKGNLIKALCCDDDMAEMILVEYKTIEIQKFIEKNPQIKEALSDCNDKYEMRKNIKEMSFKEELPATPLQIANVYVSMEADKILETIEKLPKEKEVER